MKLGIMQPYFFPYLGYYSLIKNTDKWVVFDVVQFIRHGWIERNRVLKPNLGWQYVSVPLIKHTRSTLIKDIRIRTEEDWKGKLFRQLEHYRKAPYYQSCISVIRESLDVETDSIVLLNANILKVTCAYLNIPFEVNIWSQMNVDIDPVTHAGEWALNISKALHANEYINPFGGIEIFNNEQFVKEDIKLTFLKNRLRQYSQRRSNFEPGLSIIDVLMYNDVPSTIDMLDDIEIIRP